MHINVLLFGALADEFGAAQVKLDCAESVTVEQAFAKLTQKTPALFKKWENLILYARNQEHVIKTASLKSGDELALMPPLAGG